MDAIAEKISDLVLEACALVQAVDHANRDAENVAQLEHLRARLVALADDTLDAEAAAAACGVVADIDAAIAQVDSPAHHRGAA